MEVYAAQIDRMDAGIGRIVEALKANGQLDNTLVLFLADNGGCAEELTARMKKSAWCSEIVQQYTRDGREVRFGNSPELDPGGEDTYQSYGVPWANVSNTPFREYKHWVHEGGIATPLIAHWPVRLKNAGALRHHPGQLPDVMAPFLDVAGAEYPREYNAHEILPLEGFSLMPILESDKPGDRDALYWEHEGNCAIRRGKWKLVRKHGRPWELYDMETDRTEMNDLAGGHPDLVAELSAMHEAWAKRCRVVPWAELCQERKRRWEKNQNKS